MGDVLHALPAVAALRDARPDLRIEWAIDPRWSPLLESTALASGDASGRSPQRPLIDRLHTVHVALWKRAGLSRATLHDLRDLRGKLRGGHFDLCVDLQGSLRSAAVGRMASAPRFVGSATPREMPARFLYGQRIVTRATHVVEQACDLLGGATGLRLRPASPPLPRTEPADTWAQAIMKGESRAVLLAPTAGWGAKEWPAERYGAVASALSHEGCRVLVNASSDADRTGLCVVEASNGVARLVPSTIEQMIALMRRCRLVVAGDTGPLHLAAALGIPVLGLYGPTDPARTGPWGSPSTVLRDPTSVTDHKRHATTEAGLMRIEEQQVTHAAMDLLQRG